MSADIIYSGQKYWTIARRFHQNRHNPNIKPLAVFEMNQIMGGSAPAVQRRVYSFIRLHRGNPPTNSPNSGGDRCA